MNNPISVWCIRYVIVALGFVLSSCATSSAVSNREFDTSRAVELARILVISVGENRSQSLEFENLIAARIQKSNTEAIAATAKLGTSATPDEASIVRIAQEANADGVLVTRLKSVDTSRSVEPQQTITTVRTGGVFLDGYHPYDFWETTEPDLVSMEATVTIASELFMMKDGERIWRIDSTSFRRDRANLILHESADAIVNQLMADKLIAQE